MARKMRSYRIKVKTKDGRTMKVHLRASNREAARRVAREQVRKHGMKIR